jgi:hypothetical protein
MGLSKINSFFSYGLLESKKRMGLSVNEDEVDDLADDIKGPAAKKTEAPKETPAANDDDLPDDIKTPVAKKSSPDAKKESPVETKKETDKKTSVAKDYKINMGLDVSNKSNKSSYSAYVTLFTEALNSLDRMAGLGVEVDPDAPAIKNYESDRLDIATSVDKSADGLKNAWDKIYQIAGAWPPAGSGITGIIQKNLKSNDVYKKFIEEKKALDAELNGTPKLKKEEYDKQLAEMKKKYSAKIDPKQLMVLSSINNAIGLYRNAIDKFRQGADVELGFVEKREGGIKGATENFYTELSDAIASIVLSKKPADKKDESENWIGPQESILEDFAGFLGNKKAFISGVGRGIVDGFKGGPKDQSVKSENDKTSLLYAADALKGSLLGLASEIDNVVAFKKNIQGLGEGLPDEYFEQKKKLDVKLNGTPPLERDDYVKQLAELKKKYTGSTDTDSEKLTRKSAVETEQEAKAEASEMISFVRDSFKYVVDVPKELESSSSSLASIKTKLDDISKQIAIIGRKGGTLEKWKNDVLGENRERIASTSYLEKGRELMQMAAEKAAEAANQKAIEKRYRDRDADVVFKKAVDMFKGGTGTEGALPSKIKRKGDVAVFSKDAKEPDKATVKSFQQRLIDLGHLPTGNLNGEFDEQTKNASKLGMTYIGSLSGKVYADNKEAFDDFQRDLGFYSDNKPEIKKSLGL